MEKTSTFQVNLIKLLDEALIEVNSLQELVFLLEQNEKDKATNEINRRAFVRKACILGELLTFFKEESNDKLTRLTLQPTDDHQLWLPVRFANLRNLFVHHYLYEHLLGKEQIFLDAYNYIKENISSLNNALSMLNNWKKDANQQSLSEVIKKSKKHPSPDYLFKADGDYALLVFTEISSLKFLLKNTLELDLESDTAKGIVLNKIKTNNYLKYALENYLVNSCQMLLDLNESVRNNKINDNTRKSLQNSLNNETKTFMFKLNVTRNDLAHHYTSKNKVNDQHLVDNIFLLLSVSDRFLLPLLTELDKTPHNSTSDIKLKIINTKAHLNPYIKLIVNEQIDSTKTIIKSLTDNLQNPLNNNMTEEVESKKRERELTEEEVKDENERTKKIKLDDSFKPEDIVEEKSHDDKANDYRAKK